MGLDPKACVAEIDRLAKYILRVCPNEPGKDGESESAVDVAIRLIGELKGET